MSDYEALADICTALEGLGKDLRLIGQQLKEISQTLKDMSVVSAYPPHMAQGSKR
jgi:hypothetical protein